MYSPYFSVQLLRTSNVDPEEVAPLGYVPDYSYKVDAASGLWNLHVAAGNRSAIIELACDKDTTTLQAFGEVSRGVFKLQLNTPVVC
jgi:hypothetical protein